MDFLLMFKPTIEQFVASSPKLASVMVFMGASRMFAKPVVTFIQEIVKLTPTLKDDQFLARVVESKGWRIFAWAFDYLTSIKLPGAPGAPEVKSAP
jgi:hemolysin-activating ACP:hemolysin acyltransferase